MFYNIPKVNACVNSSGECFDYYYTSTIFVCLNAISIIINILHIVVLVNMPGLRKMNYFWILLNLTLVDTFGALVFAISCVCAVYKLLLSADSGLGTILLTIAQQTTLQCRYFQLTLACFDRYYAVCKPYDYSNCRLANHFGKLSVFSWIINISIITFKVAFTADEACLDEYSIFIISNSNSKSWVDIFSSLVVVVSSVLITILLVKVSRELKRMSNKGSNISDDGEIRSATKYVIGICVMFYCSVVPLFLAIYLNTAVGIPGNGLVRTFFRIAAAGQALYGIGNVVLYGFLNPSYVQKIIFIFRMIFCKQRVFPNN